MSKDNFDGALELDYQNEKEMEEFMELLQNQPNMEDEFQYQNNKK